MSVLIRGMKTPENCCRCEWHEYYGGDYDWCHACRKTGTMPIENAETGRAEDCPLVEIPPKHGRLFDETEVKRCLRELPDSEDKWNAIALLEWAIEKRWCIEPEGE